MNKPATDKCNEYCTIKHLMSTLYKCDVHGEFYHWPKLDEQDVTWLELNLTGVTNTLDSTNSPESDK